MNRSSSPPTEKSTSPVEHSADVTGRTAPLDVGFVPAECPGTEGSGATRTSTLLVEHLSRHHDLTVYVASQTDAETARLPATDRVEYVLHDDLSMLPHPTTRKVEALRTSMESLEEHDLVHAYASAFIPVLADLDVPTISTLNSYLPVCPKEDLLYRDEEKCSGPGRIKCTSCVLDADVEVGPELGTDLKSAYASLGRLGLIERSIDRSEAVSAYHALSPHIERDFAGFGFPEDRIEVIPHFYEESFRRRPEDPGLQDESIQLLYVGRLQENKGPQVLVAALPELRARGYDVHLRVAGTGPAADDLVDFARDLDVDDRIDWLGYVDHEELPGEFAAADVFVFPGLLDEPFGRVMLEALGTMTPVLASDVGSTDYIVGDCGVRFTPGDPTALTDGFEELVADYDTHYESIPGHLERFAPEQVVDDLLDLYAGTVERESAAARAR